MNKYFKGIETLDQLRNRYRVLLKTYHPDNGGDIEICKAINKEYEQLFEILKNRAFSAAATDDERKQAERTYDFTQDAALRDILDKIIRLDNINIEIVGCWIWVDGATFPVKDYLKEQKFSWSKNRKKWHWQPYESGYRRGRKMSFDQIRSKYGSQKIENEQTEKIA